MIRAHVAVARNTNNAVWEKNNRIEHAKNRWCVSSVFCIKKRFMIDKKIFGVFDEECYIFYD